MSDIPQPSDAERFIARLNALDHPPTWTEAASLGVHLVDLSREEFAVRDALENLEADLHRHPGGEPPREVLDDIAEHRRQLATIEARPGRYFLAGGEVVQRDELTGDAYQSGWWYDQRTTLISTPYGERVHRPGRHPDAAVHPTATVDPSARVEAGATIGRNARIGPYVHVGRDTMIAANCTIQQGAWIGPGAQLDPHVWISDGATIDAHAIIGHHTAVGAGSHVHQDTQIEPYSRLGAGTTTTATPTAKHPRGTHIASAIDQIMRLDHE